MNQKQLNRLLVDDVTSRATKQKPSIRQIKFLQNEKKGKVDTKYYSRGVAFVEFTEHEHALVALRVLNNNPETFGPQHRPVIEFAVDNVQKLKIRQAKQQQFQQREKHNESEEQQPNGEEQAPDNKYKRKTREGDNTGPIKEDATRFKKKGPVHPRNETKEEAKSTIAVKDDAEKKRPRRKEKPSSNQKEATEKPNPKISKVESNNVPRKRKLGEVRGEESKNGQRKRNKKQGKGGAEVMDKLDMLVEQYKSKFSQSSARNDPTKQSLKRWFEK